MRNVSEAEIDAGAEALRERLQGGKKLNAWSDTRKSVKLKWRRYATVVLMAAARLSKDKE